MDKPKKNAKAKGAMGERGLGKDVDRAYQWFAEDIALALRVWKDPELFAEARQAAKAAFFQAVKGHGVLPDVEGEFYAIEQSVRVALKIDADRRASQPGSCGNAPD